MQDNPYQTPQSGPTAEDPPGRVDFPGRRLIFLGVSLASTLTVWFVPQIVVPGILLLSPAIFRTLRLSRPKSATDTPRFSQKAILFGLSLFAVIPVAVASLIAFCSICTPTGYVTVTALEQMPGPRGNYNNLLLAIGPAVFLGMWISLEVGYSLLKRWNYMSLRDLTETPIESRQLPPEPPRQPPTNPDAM